MNMMRKTFKIMITAATTLALVACSSAGNDSTDPWESVNRSIFGFNETIDNYVLSPVAKGYVAVVPEIARTGVTNALSNLRQPWTFANSVLQLDAKNAAGSFWSFLLDSTFGIGGLYNFTERHTDLKVRDEDFGQTLGYWGVPQGPYVVLPLFGPSSVRGATGTIAAIVLDPVHHAGNVNSNNVDNALIVRAVASAIDTRAGLIPTFDSIYDTSFDPYATLRSGYLQRRKALVDNVK